MFILDEETDTSKKSIILYLTKREALELKNSIEDLLKESHQHSHISSEDYQKEVSICLYNPSDLTEFNDRSKRLILEDR